MNIMGEFESLNFSIGVIPEDIALFHGLYRTSIKGRKDLMKVMFSDGDGVQKIDDSYTSRVAEIFNVYMKTLGIRVEFTDDDEEVKVLNSRSIRHHAYKNKDYLMTDYDFYMMKYIDTVRDKILVDNPIITVDKLQKLIDKAMEEDKIINGPLKENVSDEFLKAVDEENKKAVEALKERQKKEEEEAANKKEPKSLEEEASIDTEIDD